MENTSFQSEILSTDNIMTQRLPRYIKFINNIDIAENAKRTLRKQFGLSFKGIKGVKKQYAYRFLAQSYNADVDRKREQITRARKQRKILEKNLIKFKLAKKGKLCIKKETIEALGIPTILELILEYVGGEMVLLFAKTLQIDTDITENERYYTLTQTNVSRLVDILKKKQVEEQIVNESDLEYAGYLEETTELCVEFIDFLEDDIDANGNVKTKKGGAFFKYLNKTKFDLSRYGVYNEVVPDNYKENCLYT